jgi:hypothetical protein
MDGGQIDDFSGDRPYDTYPRGSWGQYSCAFNSKIMSNIGGCDIHVGEKFSNQGELPALAENTLIEDHAGGVSFRSVNGVPQYINPIDRRNEPPSLTAPDAVKLLDSEVGPAAMDNAPAAYRNARIPIVATSSWLIGTQQGANDVASWESWMGGPMQIYGCITPDHDTWSEFESGRGALGFNWLQGLQILPTTTPIVYSYPMFPKVVSNEHLVRPQTWDEFANGDFDSHYDALAQSWRSQLSDVGRDPNGDTLIVRLGWEMNGTWYSWSVGDKIAEFKASWVRACTRLRLAMPDIRFEFGPAHGRRFGDAVKIDYIDAIPDTNFVDFLGRSTHDSANRRTVDFASWNQYHLNSGSDWYGLNEVMAACRALNIPHAQGEHRPQPYDDCGGDFTLSPFPELVIQYLYEFMDANRDMMGYDVYLEGSCSRLHGSATRENHIASITYKNLWSNEL